VVYGPNGGDVGKLQWKDAINLQRITGLGEIWWDVAEWRDKPKTNRSGRKTLLRGAFAPKAVRNTAA